MLIQAFWLLNSCQYTIYAFAGNQLYGYGLVRAKSGLKKNRLTASIAKQIVAKAVDNGNTLIVFKALKNVRMTSHQACINSKAAS